MKPLHFGKVEKGKLELGNRPRFQTNLVKLEGKEVEISITERKSTRSLRQNAYYFGVIIKLMSKYCGYDPDEMHERLQYRFLRRTLPDGFVYVQRYKNLNTKQAETYHSQIRQWASMEYSVYIPDPNEGIDF